MDFKINRCPKCGKNNIILPSNNPLTVSVCLYCVKNSLDYNNLEHADFFCRTYNLPFDPEKWIVLSKNYKEDVFKEYISWISEKEKDTLYYTSNTTDLWKKANKEWELYETHEQLMSKIGVLKDAYVERNSIKWGSNYTFQELISLENLFVNTLKANDISNPMQIDAIKKACKMSVALDRAIISGDSKEINEFSKAYQNFIKTAKIEDIIISNSKEVIATVADLCDFLEQNNFQFDYYDNVERDVVDASINDIKKYLRTLVIENTGLESVFESISSALQREKEADLEHKSFEKVSLEDIYGAQLQKNSEEFDIEISEGIEDSDLLEDDDEYEQF